LLSACCCAAFVSAAIACDALVGVWMAVGRFALMLARRLPFFDALGDADAEPLMPPPSPGEGLMPPLFAAD